jgi:hypothetical protein
VYPCDGDADIAVLIPPRQLTVNFPLEPISDTVQAWSGQDMYFVGFPFGASSFAESTYTRHLNGDYPDADHQEGCVFWNIGEKRQHNGYLLDGYNNHGFSGAPIVFRDPRQPNDATTTTFYIFGVVSGFVPELVKVVSPEAIKNGEDISKIESWRLMTPGKILRDTEQLVPPNTGILRGYPISYALNMIHLHPDGPKTAD